MKTHTGKIAKYAFVTGYSAFVLTFTLCPTGLCDVTPDSTGVARVPAPTAAAPGVSPAVTPAPGQSAPGVPPAVTPAPGQSAPGVSPTVTSAPGQSAPGVSPTVTSAPGQSTPGSSATATPTSSEAARMTPPIPITPIPTTPTPITPAITPAPATLAPVVPAPSSDPNRTFLLFVEAVTGKPVSREVRELLQGVVSLRRKGNDVELTKADASKVIVGGDTQVGATVIGDFSDAKEKVTAKFGTEVGQLVDEFVGVTANGSHLDVIREGPEYEEIDLSEHKIKRQLPLKRVRLSKISVDVDVVDSHSVLKNITGIEVVPNAGLEIPIALKEFARSKNPDGDDVFTFGIKNPLPFLKPFKRLLGIKEIVPVTWTIKKQAEIGAKDSVEHKN
jgi:hypothetical protein